MPSPSPSDGRRGRLRQIAAALSPRSMGVVYALVLLVVALTVACAATGRPGYVGGDNIANVLEQASFVGILTVFMTITLISGNFDLSVGSTAALSAAVGLSVIDDRGFVIAFGLALLSGVAVGALNGLVVQYLGINAFIVTLGTLTAIRGLVLIITDGRTITVSSNGAFSSLSKLELGNWALNPLLIAAAALAIVTVLAAFQGGLRARRTLIYAGAVAVLLIGGLTTNIELRYAKSVYYLVMIALVSWAVLRYTVVGRRLYAVGANAEAARLSGIAVARYKVMPFVLTGLAAAFVGFLYGAKLGAVNPTALSGTELTVIAAAILGGTSLFGGSGSVVMSVVGAIFLFTIENGFNVLNLGANYQGVIEGVVLVVAAGIYTATSRRRGAAPTTEDPVAQPVAEPGTPAAPAALREAARHA
jgi:D-xylose transport system permease protein